MTGGSAVTPVAMTSRTVSALVTAATLEEVSGSGMKGTHASVRYVSNMPRLSWSATALAQNTAPADHVVTRNETSKEPLETNPLEPPWEDLGTGCVNETGEP